jgi:hypothetical protein
MCLGLEKIEKCCSDIYNTFVLKMILSPFWRSFAEASLKHKVNVSFELLFFFHSEFNGIN